MNGERNTDIDTLPCIKQRASGRLLSSRGSSAQSSVMTWRGGREAHEGGIYVYIELNHTGQQKPL